MVCFMSVKDFCQMVVPLFVANLIFVDAASLTEAPEVITSKSSLAVSNTRKISDFSLEEKKWVNYNPRYLKSQAYVIGLPTDQSSTLSNTNGSSEKSDLFPELTRRRRSTTTYSIDVAAVVDYSVYSKFLLAARSDKTEALKKTREYFAFIFDGANQRFQDLDTYYGIRVYLSQVYVAESESTSPLVGIYQLDNKVKSSVALDTFREFIKDKATDMLTSFDHVMLFTGYDLRTFLDQTSAGVSYNDSICNTDGYSVSVIAEATDYQSITAVAGNLAHSLSAVNDGNGNTCSATARYIMGDFRSTKTDWNMYHPWQFSSCSVASFTTYIQQQLRTLQGATCLTVHSPKDISIPDVSGRLLGQEVKADQQCKAIYGTDSHICLGSQKIGSELCQALICWIPGTDLCNIKAALDGTTCGDGKICRSGQCVSDQQAPTADEGCMFGDSALPVYEQQNCQQFVGEFPGYCYNSKNIQLCCTSCQAVHRNVKDCEYGDKSKECTISSCPQFPSECCGTCKIGEFFNPTPKTTVPYVPRPSNENLDPTVDVCRNKEWRCYFLSDADTYQCYDSTFKSSCCQFCQKHQAQTPGCEYGDRRPDLCRKSGSCLVNPFLCCQFCRPTTPVLATTLRAFSGSSVLYNRDTLLQHRILLTLLAIFLTYKKA